MRLDYELADASSELSKVWKAVRDAHEPIHYRDVAARAGIDSKKRTRRMLGRLSKAGLVVREYRAGPEVAGGGGLWVQTNGGRKT